MSKRNLASLLILLVVIVIGWGLDRRMTHAQVSVPADFPWFAVEDDIVRSAQRSPARFATAVTEMLIRIYELPHAQAPTIATNQAELFAEAVGVIGPGEDLDTADAFATERDRIIDILDYVSPVELGGNADAAKQWLQNNLVVIPLSDRPDP